MPRPRNFDEDVALDKALLIFWRQGYLGTSIADLVSATGLQRQSLYNTFGDKKDLFRRTLKRYGEMVAEASQPLRSPTAGLAELRVYFLNNLRMQRERRCGACLVVKTSFEHQANDPDIDQAIQEGMSAGRQLIGQVLAQARQAGELEPTADVDGLANFLFSVVNGLSALAQAESSFDELEKTLDYALATLPLCQTAGNRANS